MNKAFERYFTVFRVYTIVLCLIKGMARRGKKQIDHSFNRYVLGDMPVCCLKYLPKKD